MTAAVSPHKGVTKPAPRFYAPLLDNELRFWWGEYRHMTRLVALLDGLPPICRQHRDEARGAVKVLCALRRACRPVRLGGTR